jgi:hypothetical protein
MAERSLGGGRLHARRQPELEWRVKRLDGSRIDFLFVHVADGRRWFIPAGEVGGGCSILLGGPKYATYEVEPGEPLPVGVTC